MFAVSRVHRLLSSARPATCARLYTLPHRRRGLYTGAPRGVELMASVTASTGPFSVRAYRGDAKTLLAFDLKDRQSAKRLAGFTIQVEPEGQASYYLMNLLRF